MLSDEVKRAIIRAKDIVELTWVQIGDIFDVSSDVVRKAYGARKDISELGEKPVIRESNFTTPVMRAAKRKFLEDPGKAVRDVETELRNEFSALGETPSKSTISRWQKLWRMEKRKCVKKAFISTKNIGKRLEFAREMLGSDRSTFDLILKSSISWLFCDIGL